MTKRGWSWIFLLAAVCLAIASIWFARHQLAVLSRWKAAEGTLVSREVLRNHDSNGILYFQMKAGFRYLADGKEITSTAESYFGSPEFGSFAERVLTYKPGVQYPVRYNPTNP